MYVKKFESDTLDNALKDIKRELGPDAIILKTVTNKGLKGAFKKNRIEITAAISEKNYIKKAKVDNVLNQDEKQEFYNSSSKGISDRISQYNGTAEQSGGYGQMGLNRNVKKANQSPSLNEFLKKESSERPQPRQQETLYRQVNEDLAERKIENFKEEEFVQVDKAESRPSREEAAYSAEDIDMNSDRIARLEEQIEFLQKSLQEKNSHPDASDSEYEGVRFLQENLRLLGLSEPLIRSMCKQALFEFEREDLDDPDSVFDFALRELSKKINCRLPMFSNRR